MNKHLKNCREAGYTIEEIKAAWEEVIEQVKQSNTEHGTDN